MEISAPIATEEKKQPSQGSVPQPPAPDPINVGGLFTRHLSVFWTLIVSVFNARYYPEGMQQQYQPFKEWLAGKTDNPVFSNKNPFFRWCASNWQALSVASIFLSITTVFTAKTSNDIYEVCKEAVAFELNKPKEKVNFFDLMKSENSLVKTTVQGFGTRTCLRYLVTGSFAAPWQLLDGLLFKKSTPLDQSASSNVGMKYGVALIGTYLFADGFTRKQTPFEVLQEMIEQKINHRSATKSDAIIHYDDIITTLYNNRNYVNPNYQRHDLISPEWQAEKKVAERVADLMNQTYRNIEAKEYAHLTVGTLILLVGHGLMDTPAAPAFVELANRSTDMQDVMQAKYLIKNGADPAKVFANYGITLQNAEEKNQATPLSQEKKHTEGLKIADTHTGQLALASTGGASLNRG